MQDTNRWQAFNSCILNGNNEWRLAGVGSPQVKVGVVGGYEQSDDDDTTNVEQEDTDVDTLDSLGEVTTRVLCFTSGNLSRKHM